MVPPRIRSELPLILASLFIAGVIWLIAKQADYEPTRLSAAVLLNSVPDFMIVEPTPNKVGILVQYPKTMSNLIVEKNFAVPINVEQIFPTKAEQWDPQLPILEKEYKLNSESIKSRLDSVQVISVDPESVTLKARLRTQAANVVPATVGQLPDNLMLVGMQADPAQLLFTGPPEALAKLAASNTVKTEPVDLEELRASGQLSRRVVLPDPSLTLLGGHRMVMINVALAEKPKRKTIAGVPIGLVTFGQNVKATVDPPTASVVLEGPPSAIDAISASDIEFSTLRELLERPGRVYDVGVEARLKSTVPAEVAKQVRIVEVKPSRISVEFVPLDKQNQ